MAQDSHKSICVTLFGNYCQNIKLRQLAPTSLTMFSNLFSNQLVFWLTIISIKLETTLIWEKRFSLRNWTQFLFVFILCSKYSDRLLLDLRRVLNQKLIPNSVETQLNDRYLHFNQFICCAIKWLSIEFMIVFSNSVNESKT